MNVYYRSGTFVFLKKRDAVGLERLSVERSRKKVIPMAKARAKKTATKVEETAVKAAEVKEEVKAAVKPAETKAEPKKTEAKAETKAEPKKTEAKAETKAEPKKTEAKAETKAEPKKTEAKAETKAEPKKAEAKAETKAEPKAETKAEPKTETKAAEPAAEKKPAKKTAPKAKAPETTVNVTIQFAGGEEAVADIVANVKKVLEGNGVKDIKDLQIFVKPEERKAYYVADGVEGDMDVNF